VSVHEMIRINLKIEVAKENEGEYYLSSIQDISGETDFFIAAPYFKGFPLLLKVGESVKVRFVDNNGVYSFTSKVLGIEKDVITLYKLQFPEHIERAQRRRFVRVPATIKMFLTQVEIKDNNFFVESETETEVVNSVDISAGGVRFLCDKRYPFDATFLAKFLLKKGDREVEIKVLMRVLRSEELTVMGRQKFFHSAEFVDINHYQQDEIFNYVFARMRELVRLSVADKRRG